MLEEIKKMRSDWEKKAQQDPYYFVDSSRKNWKKEDYYQKGVKEVFDRVISFLKNKGLNNEDFKRMKILEIGCGTGRLSIALAKYFRLVEGVDISKTMIEIAKKDHPNVTNLKFYINNGLDLSQFPDNFYNFVFSFLVFQHLPKKSIAINYLKEIYRVLKPGSYMKIQIRGYPAHLPLGLADWRYHGFNSFFVALSETRRFSFFKIPYLKIKSYNSTFGVFFKEKELSQIVRKIGFCEVETFFDKKNGKYLRKYLWVTGKK